MGPHEDLLPRLRSTRTGNLAVATLLVLLGLSPQPGKAGTPAPIPVPGEFRVDGPRLVRPEPTSWVAQPAGALAFGSGREIIFEGTFAPVGGAGRYESPTEVTADGIPCTQGETMVAAEPCTLDCTASTLPTVGLAPLTVSFSATSQQTFCPEFPTFIWDFGDGTTSTIPITTHIYDQVGTYAWTLTATAAGVTCVRVGEFSAVGSFPGDCDGSAGISIGEVQQSINMFLGLQAAGCGADCSRDGVVSIGEVQKVINAFLGLTSSC